MYIYVYNLVVYTMFPHMFIYVTIFTKKFTHFLQYPHKFAPHPTLAGKTLSLNGDQVHVFFPKKVIFKLNLQI